MTLLRRGRAEDADALADIHTRSRAAAMPWLPVVEGIWLEQLYVVPDAIGTGVGRRLLDAVRAQHPGGLSLHVFANNERARRFYEAAGFVLVAEGDGRENEERTPDCTYRWEAPAPARG